MCRALSVLPAAKESCCCCTGAGLLLFPLRLRRPDGSLVAPLSCCAAPPVSARCLCITSMNLRETKTAETSVNCRNCCSLERHRRSPHTSYPSFDTHPRCFFVFRPLNFLAVPRTAGALAPLSVHRTGTGTAAGCALHHRCGRLQRRLLRAKQGGGKVPDLTGMYDMCLCRGKSISRNRVTPSVRRVLYIHGC